MAPRYQQCTYQRRSRLTPSLLLGFSLLITAACGREPPPEGSTAKVGTSAAGTPAAAAKPASQDDGMWPMPARSYDATRYSHQTEITRANVSNLREAWSFSTGVLRGHEAAPLVVGSTLYVVTPFPNILYAIDLTPPAGRLKWKYEPPTARAAQGVACCDVVNRGAAFSDGKIFFNTLDAHTVAVDAETGKEVWRTKLGEINQGESMTMAPLVVKGKVLVGNSGGEFGVRGWLTALEAATGKLSWRAYSTGPDSAVLIGPNFRAPYPQDRGKDLGVTSWPAEQWKLGGGTVWGWLSYDPQLDLVYYGTGNPGVWNPALRPGDNKWASTLFARDPDTGEARWAYQTTPHDEHDFDGVNESILVDLPIGGRTRQVMLRPERNGFLYMIDRATGQILSADPYGKVTWASEIDLKTGRPIINEAMRTGNRQATGVCPAAPGMKDWQPAAWSPHTQLLYIPHNHLCMDYQGTEANY
ncbi:MAG TPA: PQQ-dependent dehydrogenase, methanol/ethanol family, partial [Gemmatimonadales bacterium]|nr:PQQ-dependent dehydrogenase, methanol/ethanol family [Gemmatimonadales bacterium]